MIPRCLVDPENWSSQKILLSASDSHHVADVLRRGAGDPVVLCDGRGQEASGRITGEKQGVCLWVEILERTRLSSGTMHVTLVQAIPKSQKMEWIIQKATELGVREIIPVMTERGVVRLMGDKAEHRVERWQRIAEEAARQCRTAWVPRISPVVGMNRLLEEGIRGDLLLLASLEPQAVLLRDYLRSIAGRKIHSVALMIGPEGDFTPVESRLAKDKGAIPVSFGASVLRVETAAVFGVGALFYEFMGTGEPPTP